MNAQSSTEDLLTGSLLYREAQAEREEIMKHKWYESEKKGYDIGFELAQMDWRIKYGSQWHRKRQSQHFNHQNCAFNVGKAKGGHC